MVPAHLRLHLFASREARVPRFSLCFSPSCNPVCCFSLFFLEKVKKFLLLPQRESSLSFKAVIPANTWIWDEGEHQESQTLLWHHPPPENPGASCSYYLHTIISTILYSLLVEKIKVKEIILSSTQAQKKVRQASGLFSMKINSHGTKECLFLFPPSLIVFNFFLSF